MSASNRWLSKQLWRCGTCNTLKRHTEGYRPIPNPILYDNVAQQKAYVAEMNRSVALRGHFMLDCERCGVHGDWNHVTFQEAIAEKEKEFESTKRRTGATAASVDVAE